MQTITVSAQIWAGVTFLIVFMLGIIGKLLANGFSRVTNELTEIKDDGKANRMMNEATARANDATAAAQVAHRDVCNERHRLLDKDTDERLARIDREIQHLRERKDEERRQN